MEYGTEGEFPPPLVFLHAKAKDVAWLEVKLDVCTVALELSSCYFVSVIMFLLDKAVA